jgi:hypothetical protein
MKPGTLVKCPLWGKGIVVEELFQINGVTIISEVAE